jgi:SAM-dependent methyltransferase
MANILGKTMETERGHWVFRFANGLVVRTDPFMRRDAGRILPVGGPQSMILNRLVNRPEIVRGKRVLDVFAGSGIFGLMALHLGAAAVDFVDINPRAVRFVLENADRNGLAKDRYRAVEASVADFSSDRPYDVVLANPPFVMTPPCIEGTLTSNAGADGNDLTEMLTRRLEDLLAADGEAYVFILQMLAGGEPLIARTLGRHLRHRAVTLTPVQEQPCPFEHYVAGYLERFPAQAAGVREWERDLRARLGNELAAQHYIMRVPPRGPAPTTWSSLDNLASDYGAGFTYPAVSEADMALGRVIENLILPADAV